ncbi:MAG: hypothetical protein H7Y11_15395, partial [Armatimonadetes bacterium]|nr:hypothetical protein [Anaerolineae bacterium]
WQFYFTYIQQTVIGYGINATNGIIFAPLRTALYFDPSRAMIALKLTVSLALPLWVFVFYADARRNPAVLLAWLMVGIGLVQYVLLSESGEFHVAANFNWGLRTAALLLFGVSLLLVLRDALAALQIRRPTPRLIGAGALLLLHVVGGMYLYYGYASRMIPTLP